MLDGLYRGTTGASSRLDKVPLEEGVIEGVDSKPYLSMNAAWDPGAVFIEVDLSTGMETFEATFEAADGGGVFQLRRELIP